MGCTKIAGNALVEHGRWSRRLEIPVVLPRSSLCRSLSVSVRVYALFCGKLEFRSCPGTQEELTTVLPLTSGKWDELIRRRWSLYIVLAIRTEVRVVFLSGGFAGCHYREAFCCSHDIPATPALRQIPGTASCFSIPNSLIFFITVEQKHCFPFYLVKMPFSSIEICTEQH